MVYKRRYRRKRYSKPKCSTKDLALIAWKGVKHLKTLINVETKVVDIPISLGVTNGGTNNLSCTLIATGDGRQDRSGLSILAKSLHYDFKVLGESGEVGRFVIVKDKQVVADQSPPVWTDFFQQNQVNTLLNPADKGRFQILKDKRFSFNVNSFRTQCRGVINLRGHHIRYNGNATTDIQKGGIYMMFMSDFDILVDGHAQLHYYDN